MECSNCGAPLPAKSNVCTYCGTLNEVDLRGLRKTARSRGTGSRACPRCSEPLAVLVVPGLGVEVDRCGTCHGIFFDPGELDTAMEHAGRTPADVDRERLDRLIEEERKADHDVVRYVPCPDCGQLMNRKAFGARSGVVTDTCKEHGVWLDGGELAQLVKWARAGGRVHDDRVREETVRIEERGRAARETLSGVSMERWTDADRSRRVGSGDATDVADVLRFLWDLLVR
jgi:Zn-finger nucleic acid-binding protein